MHNKKPLREIATPLNENIIKRLLGNKSVLPSMHTAEGIKEYPDEAARQADNYHNHIFSKKVSYPDYDPEWEKPEMYDPDTQNKAARDAHYKMFGLKRMTIRDAQENPHHVAQYLNHMQKHFPDIADNLDHTPINTETNKAEESKGYESVLKTRHPNVIGRTIARIKNMKDDLEWKINPEKARTKSLKKMSDAFKEIDSDPTWKKLGEEIDNRHKQYISNWHSNNPDLHHLNASQVYQHFRHDFYNDDTHSGLLKAPGEKTFTKHWNNINKK